MIEHMSYTPTDTNEQQNVSNQSTRSLPCVNWQLLIFYIWAQAVKILKIRNFQNLLPHSKCSVVGAAKLQGLVLYGLRFPKIPSKLKEKTEDLTSIRLFYWAWWI